MPTPMIHMNRISGRTTTPNSKPADENMAQPEVSESSMAMTPTMDGRHPEASGKSMPMDSRAIDRE